MKKKKKPVKFKNNNNFHFKDDCTLYDIIFGIVMGIIIGGFVILIIYAIMTDSSSTQYAYITLPNGEAIEGTCSYSRINAQNRMVELVIDGVRYTTSLENVVITDGK